MTTYGIAPENRLEQHILADPRIQQGFDFGEPRRGHPEGKIGLHVEKILAYIDLQQWETYRKELRLLAMLHDTFKYVQFSGGQHHALLAAQYYAGINPSDGRIITILEHHDTGWHFFKRRNRFNEARFRSIFENIDLELYIPFNYADNCLRENTTTRWIEHVIQDMQLANAPAGLIYPTLRG